MAGFLEGGLVRGSRIGMLVLAAGFALAQPTLGAQAAVLKASSPCTSTSGVMPDYTVRITWGDASTVA